LPVWLAYDRGLMPVGRALRMSPRVRARIEALPPTFDRVLRRRRFRQRRLVEDALGRPDLLQRFRAGSTLPPGYGVGLDERVVEHPWLLAQELKGTLLDAGSSLNHRHIVDQLLPRLSALTIATLAPEPASLHRSSLSYVYADLRELPFPDGCFDVVASISTLEHVGMDNSRYGGGSGRSPDPDRQLERAVRELLRVLAPNGTLFVSVPYGVPENLGWLRQFDREGIERLAALASPRAATVVVYRYAGHGWQLTDLDQAADARYRELAREPRPADGASNARAVACLRLTLVEPVGGP